MEGTAALSIVIRKALWRGDLGAELHSDRGAAVRCKSGSQQAGQACLKEEASAEGGKEGLEMRKEEGPEQVELRR